MIKITIKITIQRQIIMHGNSKLPKSMCYVLGHVFKYYSAKKCGTIDDVSSALAILSKI